MKTKHKRIRDSKGRFTKAKPQKSPAAGWGWPLIMITLIILVQLVAVGQSRAVDLESAAAIESEFKKPIEVICKTPTRYPSVIQDVCEELSYELNEIRTGAAI